MIIQKTVVLFLLLTFSACGWNSKCTKRTSYDIGKEVTSVVGAAMIQTGCFEIGYEPRGLNRTLWNRSPETYAYGPAVEQELIYSGRVGDILNITYREYYTINQKNNLGSTNLIRGDYTQNVSYDLKTSDMIIFKGWELKVLEANNQTIRFKVVKQSPLAEWYFY